MLYVSPYDPLPTLPSALDLNPSTSFNHRIYHWIHIIMGSSRGCNIVYINYIEFGPRHDR
jgi:hypothetical protein